VYGQSRIVEKKKKSVFVEFETEDSALAAIAAGTINYDDEKEYELAIKSKVDYLNEQEQLKNQFQNNKRKKSHDKKYNTNNSSGNYTSGCLLKITNVNEILDENEEKYVFRDNLKAAFAEFGKVLFVDQRDETGNCVLRFWRFRRSKKCTQSYYGR